MKKIISIVFVLQLLCASVNAQSLSELKDRCYYYIENQDTVSFKKTYIKLSDAAEKEMDSAMYSVRNRLNGMRERDQGIRLLLIDAQQKYGSDNALTQKVRTIMNAIDNENALLTQQIIDTYG